MPEKIAPADHPIHDLLARRWSPVAWADRDVEPETLRSLLEAARWAASCYNEQPWRFLVATRDDREGFDRILGCLAEANQAWAKNAPVLMLSVASLRFARNGKPNRWAQYDLGMAVGNLVAEATARGLYVHQMGGFDAGMAREACGIPDDHEPVAAIALGYHGDPDSLPDDLAQRESAPRKRNPLEEVVFTTRFGTPSTLLE